MAWVRLADGSRRKVERVAKADAERGLNELLAARRRLGQLSRRAGYVRPVSLRSMRCSTRGSRGSARKRGQSQQQAGADEVPEHAGDHPVPPGWARAPHSSVTCRSIARAWRGVERVVQTMADARYATSTIDHTWTYLNPRAGRVLGAGMSL